MKLKKQFKRIFFILFLILYSSTGINAAENIKQPKQPKIISFPNEISVPSVVAIPRPTVEEVALAEKTLEKFINKSSPAIKEINRKYPGLISVRVPRPNTAIVPNLAGWFNAKHQENLKVARQGDM